MSTPAASLSSLPVDPEPEVVPVELEVTRRRLRLPGGGLRVPTWLKGSSSAPTFIGVGVAIVGFVLIMVAWGQVAGETQVYLQMPYLVSAGFTGLALVMVGLTIVNVAAKQRDAVDRDRQIDQLVSILGELKSTMQDSSGSAGGATGGRGRRR